MDGNKFNSLFWNYYIMIEDNVVNLSRYIDFRDSNLKTCSNEIISQLLNIGSEIDVLCKEICILKATDKKEMKTYSDWFIKNINNIDTLKISVRNTSLGIQPFKQWKKEDPEVLPWWKAYNDIKHNRVKNFEEGNLENLINALGALYFLEMFYIKKIANESKDTNYIDVPMSPSKLFLIKNWVTKFSVIGHSFYIDYIPGV